MAHQTSSFRTARSSGGTALVRRALRTRRVRSAIALFGIATSVLLVLVLSATYRSVSVSVASYIGQPGADLWLAPRGTDNLVRSSALVSDELLDDVAAVEGVRAAAPVLRSFMTAEPGTGASAQRRGLTLLAIGYRAPDGRGGPARVTEGHGVLAPDEVVLDRAAAFRLGVGVGDEIRLNGRPMRIVGTTSHTNLVSTQFVFLDQATAGRLSGYTGRTSFMVVELRPDASASDVARRITTRFPELAAYGHEEFVANNEVEVFAGFKPIQLLVSIVGLIAASVLVALLVQATVDDRMRDIAVLFAMGAPASMVARAVVVHTARLVMFGTLAGALGAQLLAAALNRWVPTVDMSTRVTDIVWALAVFGVIGVVASTMPLIRLRRIDPVEAFRP